MNVTRARSTRASYACGRCYRRRKKCDRAYPACSQCTNAKVPCVGIDRSSEAEVPRSLVSFLEEIVAQLELEQERLFHCAQNRVIPLPAFQAASTTNSPLVSAAITSTGEVEAAYKLATRTAKDSAPAIAFNGAPRFELPYYRAFFLSAELPFPIAFQEQRPINIPPKNGDRRFTQLPNAVAERLMAVYLGRILPQYPIFLKEELIGLFQRFKISDTSSQGVTPNERFIILMILAIATVSSRTGDYRKKVSLAESLRRDALSCLDFGLSLNSSTTTTIQQLLLLAQYGYIFPSAINLWQVVGEATRIALGLGMHQETPLESGTDPANVDFRRRLFWTLFAMERTVAITSHRPYAVTVDHISTSFPLSYDDPNFPNDHMSSSSDQDFVQVPYIRFVDRVRFLMVQSEICSINVGMRPIPDANLSYDTWLMDVERRISAAKTQAATPKWCAFMEWHSVLLLHMPCARNPQPCDDSVLKYFDAAVKVVKGHWEMIESTNIDYPWHLTHHCYEAGNLILYGLWFYRALIRAHYTTTQIFETVHQISGFFVFLEKQWPEAQQCGALFDRLRKGALNFFKDEGSPDSEPSFEAKQLKDLVFRENADLLYAHERPVETRVEPTFEDMFTDCDIDYLFLDNDNDLLGFFTFSDDSRCNSNPSIEGALTIESQIEDQNDPDPEPAGQDKSSDTPQPLVNPMDGEAQVHRALQRIPVCSHCKRRRIKCDMILPACRNCTKLHQDCRYWDDALSKETSRKHLHALKQHFMRLSNEVKILSDPIEPVHSVSDSTTGVVQPDAATLQNRMSERSRRRLLSNISCHLSFESNKPSSLMYFGPTSSFARLANEAGRSLPLWQDHYGMPIVSQPLMLFDSIYSSSAVQMTGTICQADSQTLAWHYYRSIEMTYPILGQDLITQTLRQFHDKSLADSNDAVVHTRYKLILAISLALLGVHDQRLHVLSDIYFDEAISCGTSSDLFVYPTNQSLQLQILLCIYAWLRPSVIDVWRLLGHASRMCLDIIEALGSKKTDSAYTGVLFRTLYTLETHISICFGRPHHLPDGKDVPACSPDPAAAAELSTMTYNLARLQNRLYRDMISSDHLPAETNVADFSNAAAWMMACVHDINGWLAVWNAQLDALFDGSAQSQATSELKSSFENYGVFQRCEALLLAKIATDRHGHHIISPQDALTLCKELLQAMERLHPGPNMDADVLSPIATKFFFPYTWTRMHTVFEATLILLQHLDGTEAADAETKRLFQVGLDLLMSLKHIRDIGTAGLVNCIRNMHQSKDLSIE